MSTASDPTWLSAAEAAARLGVTRATLYSYVSRGLLHPQAAAAVGQAGRGKRYRRNELERLAARHAAVRQPRQVAGAALDFGLPVLASGLCLIEQGRFYYRGVDALALAERASLEEVAGLLWACEPAALVSQNLVLARGWRPAAPGAPMAQRLLGGLASLGEGLAPPSTPAQAWPLVQALLVAATGQPLRPVGAPLHQQLAQAWGLPAAAAEPLRRALVLCADHELNPSSFTARCVASTGATPAAAVLAALAALTGPRHGGLSEELERLWPQMSGRGALGRVARWIAEGTLVPGFGHRLYPEGDPRAAALMAGLKPDAARQRLIRFMQQRLGRAPNLDFGLVALRRALGAPEGAAMAIFAIGRTVGWIAHVFEQQASGMLIRPRARYDGPPPARELAPVVPAGRVIRRR